MTALRLQPELEAALRRIPDVSAASVVTDPRGVPTEVHVLARPGKPPKQLVRDVQSLALAQFDIDIDHRIVSIVQIGDDEAQLSTRGARPAPRVVLVSTTVRTAGPRVDATVIVAAGEDLHEGTADGAAVAGQRPRVVAAAAVAALTPLLAEPCTVEWAGLVGTGDREVALCVLALASPRGGEQVVTGSAIVRTDPADAVCRAVLDALNRQLVP